MRVVTSAGSIELGEIETGATIGIVDYSRRVTDDFGVTTVVKRGFARRMSVNIGVPFDRVDDVQQLLVDLRATPATWIADDRFGSFSIEGFYKDFEVNLAVPPLSFCALTVEGLTEEEAFADPGGDPAIEGLSTLRLLDPVEIVGAKLVSSTVPEDDAPAWSAGTTYPAGARVILAATHRVYESVVDGNVGADPSGTDGKWIVVGPTNRWAAFDQALGTATILDDDVEVVLQPGAAIGAIALLDTSAGSVRLRAPGYDRTQFPTRGKVLFLDLAVAAGDAITITATPAALVPGDRHWDDGAHWMDDDVWQDSQAAGDGTVTIGTMLVGVLRDLGVTEAAPTTGITDYSRKVTDDFGDTTVVQRAWSKRMAAKAAIRTDAIDLVMGRMAAVRAKPCLWLGDATVDALAVYGFFRDFEIRVDTTMAMLSLSIEGLSKAAPVPEPAPPPTSVVAEGSVDGVRWHPGLEAGDVFMRISNDGGATFGTAVRVTGEDGSYQQQIFKRSPTQPATPTGSGIPAGWSDGIPAGTDLIWQSSQYQRNGLALGAWSTPQNIKGDKGDKGENAPLVLTQWSVDGETGWHDDYADGDIYQRQSNDDGATWGPALRVIGEAGGTTEGTDGTSPSIVFRRSATVPATPARDTGNPPPGWSDGPPAGTALLWQSVSRFRGATQLADWSPPVRITGDKGEPGEKAPLVQTQWSVDGNSSWHDTYTDGDLYQRQSNDNGTTWGPAVRVVGESGGSSTGQDGVSPSIVFKRSATFPATPAQDTGNPPPGWSDGPPAGSDFLWQSTSKFRGPLQIQAWSTPVRITGPQGSKGDNAPSISILASAVTAKFNAAGAYVGGSIFYRATTTNAPTGAKVIFAVYKQDGTLVIEDTSAQLAASSPGVWGAPDASTLEYKPAGIYDGLTNVSNPLEFRVRIDGTAVASSTSLTRIKDGDPGAAGRPAVVFQQDATPANPVVGDTWVTVTPPKIWRKWDGASWVQILGNVSALDIITEAYIDDLSVGSAKIKNLSVTSLKIGDQAVVAQKLGNSAVQQVGFRTLTYDVAVPRGAYNPGGPGGPAPGDPGDPNDPGYYPDQPMQ